MTKNVAKTWGWVYGLSQVSPQFDWEEAIHWDEGHLGGLVDVLPQSPAHIHSAREAERRLSDVLGEDRDDGDVRSNGHCSKALPGNIWILIEKSKFTWIPRVLGSWSPQSKPHVRLLELSPTMIHP